jgi:hypothetical protein
MSVYVEVMEIKPGMPRELHFWNICIKNLQSSMVSEIDIFFCSGPAFSGPGDCTMFVGGSAFLWCQQMFFFIKTLFEKSLSTVIPQGTRRRIRSLEKIR